MLILLKISCFAIWFIIMLFMIQAGRLRPAQPGREIILSLTDAQEAEKKTRQALRSLHPYDRLVLQIPPFPEASPTLHFIVTRFCRYNPSILIYIAQPGAL